MSETSIPPTPPRLTFPCTVTFDVTAEDIAMGKAGYCAECPIALAGRRATGLFCLSGPSGIYLCESQESADEGVAVAVAPTPKVAHDFMERFDARGIDYGVRNIGFVPCQPFSFDVTFLDPMQRAAHPTYIEGPEERADGDAE